MNALLGFLSHKLIDLDYRQRVVSSRYGKPPCQAFRGSGRVSQAMSCHVLGHDDLEFGGISTTHLTASLPQKELT